LVGWRVTNPNPRRKEVNQVSKKRFVVFSTVALAGLLLVSVIGATLVSAQETDPTPAGPGAHGRRDVLGWDGGSWTMFDTAAEALGLTPAELFTELHDEGKTLSEVAEEQGVDTAVLDEAMNASRTESMRGRIQQDVADGTISQEQADWMLEGLDKGFMGGRHGMGPGGFGGPGAPLGGGE
jgi:hypothetical protein